MKWEEQVLGNNKYHADQHTIEAKHLGLDIWYNVQLFITLMSFSTPLVHK